MASPHPPTLVLDKNDSGCTNVRAVVRERGFDGILFAGFRAREMYETYISDDYNEGCVLFPLEGDPVVITWAYLRVMRARWSAERGTKLWVDDYRVATSGMGVAEVFREKHLAESSLGVVGLSSQAPTEIYGAIPANFWMELTTALPKARSQDISEEFSHLMLVKSDEELAQVRYAARAAEAACKVIAEVAAPGVGEEVVFAEGTAEMLRRHLREHPLGDQLLECLGRTEKDRGAFRVGEQDPVAAAGDPPRRANESRRGGRAQLGDDPVAAWASAAAAAS